MAAHQAAFEQGDSELWYVAMGPGETKLLTLEQLDDLFRLEIIDADTRLWQPGMREWLPLSVVAGLDDSPKASAPPPPSARVPRAQLPPPAPVRPAPVAARPAPVPAPAPPPRVAPVSMSSLPPGRPVPVSVSTNPWPAPAPSVAPQRSAYPAPESLRPLTFSQAPVSKPRGTGGFGRFVLTLAALSGVGITLYRNDVLHEAARSAGLEKNYLTLESALGGPGFGTPRSVASMVAVSTASSFSVTEPAKSLAAPSVSEPAKPVSEPAKMEAPAPALAETKSSQSASTPTKEPAAAPAPEKHEAPSRSMAASIGGASKSKPAPAPAPQRSSGGSRSKADAPSPGLGFKGGSSTYDPLNGKL